ncbi:hypothetical protein DIPPA_10615 [Diplonema papillatum]|nr:hypothetical protein DIPPA_10615 [Diplonema papillatum]
MEMGHREHDLRTVLEEAHLEKLYAGFAATGLTTVDEVDDLTPDELQKRPAVGTRRRKAAYFDGGWQAKNQCIHERDSDTRNHRHPSAGEAGEGRDGKGTDSELDAHGSRMGHREHDLRTVLEEAHLEKLYAGFAATGLTTVDEVDDLTPDELQKRPAVSTRRRKAAYFDGGWQAKNQCIHERSKVLSEKYEYNEYLQLQRQRHQESSPRGGGEAGEGRDGKGTDSEPDTHGSRMGHREHDLRTVLEEAHLEKLYAGFAATGLTTVDEVEELTPGELQRLVPAVGTRRKLLNVLRPDCPAGQSVMPPAVRTDPFQPHRAAPAKPPSPIRREKFPVFSRAVVGAHKKTTDFVRREQQQQQQQERSSSTAGHLPPPARGDLRDSYLRTAKGTGTEFNGEVGGFAKEIIAKNSKHVQPASARTSSATAGSAAGRGYSRSTSQPHTAPNGRAKAAAAGRSFARGDSKSNAFRKSHTTAQPASARGKRSARSHSAGRSPPPSEGQPDIPPPPPVDEINGKHADSASNTPVRGTPEPRQRPVYISRASNVLFHFLTSEAVNMPTDRAVKTEQMLIENEVKDVRTLKLLSDGDMVKLGIPLGFRRKIQAAFCT